MCLPLAGTSVHTTSSGPGLTPSQSLSIPLSGHPFSPTTSIGSFIHSLTPIREYTILMCIVSTAVSSIYCCSFIIIFSNCSQSANNLYMRNIVTCIPQKLVTRHSPAAPLCVALLRFVKLVNRHLPNPTSGCFLPMFHHPQFSKQT